MKHVEFDHADFSAEIRSRGWAKHLRLLKADLRRERDAKLYGFKTKTPLDPSTKDYLLSLRDSTDRSLRGLSRFYSTFAGYDRYGDVIYDRKEDPSYPSKSAELRLKVLWFGAKLSRVGDGTIDRRVGALIEELHLAGNDHLAETVGLDNFRRPIPRYRGILDKLEGDLSRRTQPRR